MLENMLKPRSTVSLFQEYYLPVGVFPDLHDFVGVELGSGLFEFFDQRFSLGLGRCRSNQLARWFRQLFARFRQLRLRGVDPCADTLQQGLQSLNQGLERVSDDL